MACTPGGEARALLPASPCSFSCSFFSVFFLLTCCLFLFLVLLAPFSSFFSSFFFDSPGRERGRPREITRPPWAPARPSRAQRSLLSQFANRAPGPRIVHLHFTIFRSEINTAPSALPTTTRLLARSSLLFSASRARGPPRPASSRLLGRSPRHGPPTQKTGDAVAVLAKYRGARKLMRDRLSAD